MMKEEWLQRAWGLCTRSQHRQTILFRIQNCLLWRLNRGTPQQCHTCQSSSLNISRTGETSHPGHWNILFIWSRTFTYFYLMMMMSGPQHPMLSGQDVSPWIIGITSLSNTGSSSSWFTWNTRCPCSSIRWSSTLIIATSEHVFPVQKHVTVRYLQEASCWNLIWGLSWLNTLSHPLFR